MCEYSVVIPSFNRADVLAEVLDGLAAQREAPPFEVVVVDDGSTDASWALLQARERAPEGLALRCFRQENQGPAAARNRGVELARGRRVAFLGDDTVPSKGWLRAHAEAEAEWPDEPLLGVIGYTRWHPRMRLDPFLRYINEYGLQFGYALIDQPDDVPFNFLYTSNLSLPRQSLLDEPFDLRFPYPAWEDIELGYRLKKRGLRLVYRPAAVVEHDHPTRLARFKARQEKAGYSAVVFQALHPELGPFLGLGSDGPPPPPPRLRQRLLEMLASALQPFPVKTARLWEEVLRFHYIAGLHRGWHARSSWQQVSSPISGVIPEDSKGAHHGLVSL
jgi:glycosyltransferase involved in cell wall biosynthesis